MIDRFTLGDLDGVRALFRDYAAGIGVDLAYQDFAGELAGLPGKYAAPSGALLIARDGDAMTGCVCLRALDGDVCEMKRLYVTPGARGTGLGKALVEAVLAAARELGYREIRLDTLPTMTGAIALYRTMGFEATQPYYDTPIVGTHFMTKKL